MIAINRELVNAALSGSGNFDPPGLMRQLARRVNVLGLIGSSRGVKAILDALGDSVQVQPGDPFYCAESSYLVRSAKKALARIGTPGLPTS